jgi:hypothetical protein
MERETYFHEEKLARKFLCTIIGFYIMSKAHYVRTKGRNLRPGV